MEITVIDDSDHVGWLASATRTGEVYMKDVKSMVANVLVKAGGRKISRLNVLDHGNKKSFQIGADVIKDANLAKHAATLGKLKGKFSQGGFMHLQHCDIGQNWILLIRIAKIIGVPVVAGTGKHNPIYRFNFGEYVECRPNGSCIKTARP